MPRTKPLTEKQRLHLFTPGLPQQKVNRHVPSIYTTGREKFLRLTMVDILRLFADRPEVQHFDDVRRLDLIPLLEERIAIYVAAGGNINFSSKNIFVLTTPKAFEKVEGSHFYTLDECIKRDAA
jgi:hypothetical protein